MGDSHRRVAHTIDMTSGFGWCRSLQNDRCYKQDQQANPEQIFMDEILNSFHRTYPSTAAGWLTSTATGVASTASASSTFFSAGGFFGMNKMRRSPSFAHKGFLVSRKSTSGLSAKSPMPSPKNWGSRKMAISPSILLMVLV